MSDVIGGLYASVLLIYAVKEFCLWRATRMFNVPRNLLLLGTALSWFVGIIVFDNDLAFTATNVVAHGIPYLALSWLYAHKQNQWHAHSPQGGIYVWPWLSQLFKPRKVLLYLVGLMALAWLEEGLWDSLVWQEYGQFFIHNQIFTPVQDSQFLMWLVPLLTLPQVTHYVLDAFIWRLQTPDTSWKQILFYS